MSVSNFQQLQQSKFGSDSLANRAVKQMGGVRKRNETQAQMQQRLYGEQNEPSMEEIDSLFPAQPDFQQNLPTQPPGQSQFDLLQQIPMGQNSLSNRGPTRAGGVRKRGETQEQMQMRIGQYGEPVNFFS